MLCLPRGILVSVGKDSTGLCPEKELGLISLYLALRGRTAIAWVCSFIPPIPTQHPLAACGLQDVVVLVAVTWTDKANRSLGMEGSNPVFL